MSSNQIRTDRNVYNPLYRHPAPSSTFNQQRGSSSTHSKPGPAAGASTPFPLVPSNRSFKKNNNAQGGQSRTGVPAASSSDYSHASTPRGLQNGSHMQPLPPGTPDALVASALTKPAELPASQKSGQSVPKVPAPQSATSSSQATAPATPTKASGDQLKPFSFQFGSISPGFVNKMPINKMQIPARTSSAPPNLDEQKRDQVRHESLQMETSHPSPMAPKQQVQGKDLRAVDEPDIVEPVSLTKPKRDVQASPTLPVNQTQKSSVLSMNGMPVQIPFQQQLPGSFAGLSQQIQSQAIAAATSLHMAPMAPMPIPLQMSSTPQVQQQIYISGLPPHPLQPQGIVHQGQSLGFTTQMCSQLPPQSGTLGMHISSSQYQQQPGGKYVGQRKSAVRITDPKTHEEVKFDSERTDLSADSGSSGTRSHPNIPPHTQPLPSYAQMSYYHNPYNHNAPLFRAPCSVPLTSAQAQCFNYSINQSVQNVAFINPSVVGSIGSQIALPDQPILDRVLEGSNVISSAPPATIQVTVRPPAPFVGEKNTYSIPISSPLEKAEPNMFLRASVECNPSYPRRELSLSPENSLQNPKYGNESMTLPVVTRLFGGASVSAVDEKLSSNMPSASSTPFEESGPIVSTSDGRKNDPFCRSVPVSDYKIDPDMKEQIPFQRITQSLSSSELPVSGSGVQEPLDSETLLTTTLIKDGASETANEPGPSICAITPDDSESKAVPFERITSSSAISCAGISVEVPKKDFKASENLSEEDLKASENLSEQASVETLKVVGEIVSDSFLLTPVSNEVPALETAQKGLDEPVICHSEVDRIAFHSDVHQSSNVDSTYSGSSQGEKSSNLGTYSHKNDVRSSEGISTTGGLLDQLPGPTQYSDLLDEKHDRGQTETIDASDFSIPILASNDKSPLEMARVKSTTVRAKKKRRDILQKADAAGMTSDLYMAYKGPDEKKETFCIAEGSESSSSSLDSKQLLADIVKEDVAASEENAPSKHEPDDWEDAADISMPEVETSEDAKRISGILVDDKDVNGSVARKYSKNFLLKFAENFTELPNGFEVTPDIESLMATIANLSYLVGHDSYPKPGKVDRPTSAGSHPDRRGSGIIEDERWSKIPGPFISGREPRMDMAYTANPALRPGQGANYGVLRNPRAHTPAQYAGGLLSGSMQSVNSQGLQRNGSEADRWQRANFQKGLIPSLQNPLNTMHKAGRKYEIGKVSDEEEAKQRQLKAILNKLTPQNFEKLFEQVKAVNIDNAKTLTGVISQIFDKALMEPTFCEMYANFCFHLSGELPDFSEDNEKITFRRLLLNKCQEEFERGEKEQEEANKVDEENAARQSDGESEENRTNARRRMLGNIRLIGELYKKKMLTERIMHECIKQLLGQSENPELSQSQCPDEEDVEALCKLMSTIGEMIDHPRAKGYMDSYFESMTNLSNNISLSSRVRFMLKDAIDLRKNKWQRRRKVEGPKKIEEVHRDAAQERQTQANRLSRGPNVNASARRGGPAMEYGQRASTSISSQNVHVGGFRGFANHVRGYGSQDVPAEPQHSYEARTLTTHLPQRLGDDSITLGPQGGLARGMSIRGPQSVPTSVAEVSSIPGDSTKMTDSTNGYSSIYERTMCSSREDPVSRSVPERISGAAAFDQSSVQVQSMNIGNRDMKNSNSSFDRSLQTSPTIKGQGSALRSTLSSENILSEDYLRNKSMAAIKEYYSARDEKEVALCIKELNSPSFYPSMISHWVSDSFERKDVERDLLAKLLVNLSKSSDGTLSQAELSKGFKYVLTDLEDAVSDAPKAPEYMGQMFARVIIENVLSLVHVGQLIYEGGEEAGYLLQSGLAADVIGNALEAIKLEKGEGGLADICGSAKLRLETFRPPEPMKSRILDKYV